MMTRLATAFLTLCAVTAFAPAASAVPWGDVTDVQTHDAQIMPYGMGGMMLRRHVRIRERTRASRHTRERLARHRARTKVVRASVTMIAKHGRSRGESVPETSGGTTPVSEARRWIGTNPTGRSSLWCARFMNFVLRRTGHQGTSSDMARSFASYGHRLSGPQIGAIAVMSRGRSGGHVGVVSGIDRSGNPIIISGNHGHRVGEGVYSRGRIYAYVMP
jgi:uncharacterized protein (TIGR02594 family)